MYAEGHKGIIRRYFLEAVDKGNANILRELFDANCVINRLEWKEPIRGLDNLAMAFTQFRSHYSEMTTTIHDLIAEGDRVASRASHKAVHAGEWTSRLGRHAVGGRTVLWTAMAIFRFREGKISEQWVNRDELGMLLQLGVLPGSLSSS